MLKSLTLDNKKSSSAFTFFTTGLQLLESVSVSFTATIQKLLTSIGFDVIIVAGKCTPAMPYFLRLSAPCKKEKNNTLHDRPMVKSQ